MNLSVSEELLERIRKIDWFKNCGNPLNIPTEFNIRYVNSWKEAKTFYTDQIWSDSTLEARNILTEYLYKYFIDEYKKWNEYCLIDGKFIDEEIMIKIVQIKEKNKLDKKFVSTVEWSIFNTIMEDVYKEAKDRPTFFLKLLEIYEAGNFPCGWIGTWPEGTLVVF